MTEFNFVIFANEYLVLNQLMLEIKVFAIN